MTWYFKSVWSQQWDTQKVLSSRRDTTKVSTLRRHIWKVVFSAWPRLKTDLKTSDVRPKTFQKRFQDNKIILKKLAWDIIKVTKSVMLLEKSYPQGDHILTDDPFLLVGIFCSRATTKKKGHITQPSKMATVQRPTPWPILLISPSKIML